MVLIKEKVSLKILKEIAQETFGNLVKAVIDIEKRIIVAGGELHSDEEAFLIEMGSKQENLWGINVYPDADEDKFIEFDSMINLKPSRGNRTRSIEDPEIKKKVIDIVNSLIEK